MLRAGDRDLSLGDCRVVWPDHAQELAVAQHLLDVLDTGVGRVSGLTTVVESLELDGEALDSAGVVLLLDRKLNAVLRRLAADRTDWKVGPDLDRALGAAAGSAAGEGDQCRRNEDCQSPSSNHLVPPCVCGKARNHTTTASPSLAALFPTFVGARVRRRRVRPHG